MAQNKTVLLLVDLETRTESVYVSCYDQSLARRHNNGLFTLTWNTKGKNLKTPSFLDSKIGQNKKKTVMANPHHYNNLLNNQTSKC